MSDSIPRGIEYRETSADYFKKRELKRHAGVFSLWAFAIGLVISGNYFGWNFGLVSGGFGGMIVGVLAGFILYGTLSFCIAEMSAAIPHTGGAYSFGRTAMGPWGGFITGLAESIAYIGAGATVVVGIGGYSASIASNAFGVDLPQPLWWAIWFAIFLTVNIAGIEQAYGFAIAMAIGSTLVLVIFWVGAIPHFDLANVLSVPVSESGNQWFPGGIQGAIFALPFAAWMFFGVESLPLSAEEVREPQRTIPKALLLSMITLGAMGLLTVFFASGTSPGAYEVGMSEEPLAAGFNTIFGGIGGPLLALMALIGLITSFHGVIFTYGRNIYSLSRAGYYPTALSLTHGKRKTPYMGLIVGTVIAYGVALILHYSSAAVVGAALLSMSVFGGVIVLLMEAIAFIRLRIIMPDIERPYKNPLGIPGAMVTIVLAALVGLALFWNVDNRPGVIGTAIVYAIALGYFGLVGRKRLVLSSVEEFANENRSKAAATTEINA